MAKMRVSVDTGALDMRLLTPEGIRESLRKTGYKYMLQVRKRTRRGESVDGGSFRPYSPAYAENKQQAGRMGRNYWLRMTGQMLSSMVVNVIGRVMTVTFEGTRMAQGFRKNKTRNKAKRETQPLTYSDRGEGREVSNALLAWANNKLRPFVGVNGKELRELGDFLRRELRKSIRKTRPA
jgi:hypothetical protein